MRKSIILSLILLVALAGQAYADSSWTSTLTPKSGKLDFMSGGAVAVTDQSNGYTQRVDSDGAAQVIIKGNTVVDAISANDLNSGITVKSGAARLNGIVFGGPTCDATDYMLVYDATSATGTPKFDISLGTTADTVSVAIPGGVNMSSGIFAVDGDAGSNGCVATFAYDD